MNKADFEQLADVRIEEAKILLDQGKFDGAYYLAGYAIECALKACIAKLTNQHDFPPDKKFVDACYTHDIDKLVEKAGLKTNRDADAIADKDLADYWQLAKDWTEQSRYHRKQQVDAENLFEAINDSQHGVLQWIKRHW
jgi:HEPN domain-containing protein